MLQKIIDFSVKNKLIIGLFTITLILFGAVETTKLPIDAVPDITNNQVQIISVAPSLGATDIERLITFPIEQANSNISGIKEIRSFSRFGLSLVTIVFNDNVDVYWARQQVAERLNQVKDEIPQGVGNISMGPVSTGLGEIYQYTVRAKPGFEKKYDAMELRTIQDWLVRRQLLGVKGVADVSSFGGKLKQYEIGVDPARLQSMQISMQDIFDALEKNNQNTGGAYIEKGPSVLYIRSEGLLKTKEDIEKVLVKKSNSGVPITIADIATVKLGNATRYGALCYNDAGEVAGAVVMMLKGENANNVIKNVKERITQIQKTLPEGVVLEPFLDRTKMVNNAIGTVKTNLIEAAIIVLLVLILFLGNLRAGFLVASVIPLAMLFAVIMMNLFGVIGNLMSLGALDFGLIIDGAVFIVEAVLHQLSHSKSLSKINILSKPEMDEQVSKSSGKMSRSVVFGQLIILIVYLPTFALRDIEGKMFIPMAQTVSFALLGAFILSLTYVPMMSAWMLSRKISHKKTYADKMMEFLEIRFQHLLEKILNIPKTVVLTSISLVVISFVVLSFMGGEFIPALEEGDFAVETRVLTGSNINTTIENSQKVVSILKKNFPEVLQIVTKIGSGEIPTDPMPMEAADMMIILKDKSEWSSAKTFPELADKMQEAASVIPGVALSFQYPVQMRFNELMTGAKQDIVCKIFGENLDTLAKYAEKLGAMTTKIEGTENLYVEPVSGLEQILITHNRAAISQYGLTIDEVNKVINTGLAGQSAGLVYEGEKRFDLVVRIDAEKRQNIEDIRNLVVPTADGSQIPLQQLANIELKEGPNQIQREDAKRRIIVGFNARGRDVASIVGDLQKMVSQNLKLPSGYFITYGGAFENLNAAKARLGIAVPIALFLIFLLLYFSFQSVKQALLIYSAIPLSAVGGILALAARGMPFSISAGVGFIALFGVAVLNGIVLIAEFNRLKKEGSHDTRRIVLMGTKIRLRPVLITAFVASLGFLPMAVSSGAGAEVQRPLATVVIGGLLLSTLLTLFVLPILYIWFEKINFKRISFQKKTISMLLFFILSGSAVSQKTISYQAACDSAWANNLQLQGARLNSEIAKQLISIYKSKPMPEINLEYGQFNSIFFDNKFGVSQAFNPPGYRNRVKKWQAGMYTQTQLETEIQKWEMRRNIAEIFADFRFFSAQENLWLVQDSMFANVLAVSNKRLQTGEIQEAENLAIKNQREKIAFALKEIKVQQNYLQLQLQYFIQTKNLPVPENNLEVFSIAVISDTTNVSQHPWIKLNKQKELQIANQYAVQKLNLKPAFTIGYSSTTIQGTGANNVEYGLNTRFQSIQAGISVPIWQKAEKSKLQALQMEQTLVKYQTLDLQKQLSTELAQAVATQTLLWNRVQQFKDSTLPANQQIKAQVHRQFHKGEINYLEWHQWMQQCIQTELEFTEIENKLMLQQIQLYFLQNKN